MPDIAQYPGGLVDPVVDTLKRNNELKRLETQKRDLIEQGDRDFRQGVEIAKARGGDVTGLEGVSKSVGESGLSIGKQTQREVPEDVGETIFGIIDDYTDDPSEAKKVTLRQQLLPYKDVMLEKGINLEEILSAKEPATEQEIATLDATRALAEQRRELKPDKVKPVKPSKYIDVGGVSMDDNEITTEIDGLKSQITVITEELTAEETDLEEEDIIERGKKLQTLAKKRKALIDKRNELRSGGQEETVVGDDEFNKAMDEYKKK